MPTRCRTGCHRVEQVLLAATTPSQPSEDLPFLFAPLAWALREADFPNKGRAKGNSGYLEDAFVLARVLTPNRPGIGMC